MIKSVIFFIIKNEAYLDILGLDRESAIDEFLTEECGGITKEELIQIIKKEKPELFI